MRKWLIGLLFVGLSFALSFSDGRSQEKKPVRKDHLAFTNPKEAGPDFVVQGEYVGEVAKGDEKNPLGAQVIALGDGKFRIKFIPGGLPGAGGKGKPWFADAATEDGKTTIKSKGVNGSIADNVLQGDADEGAAKFSLKKVERKSPTLGKKPPEGAIILFDGSNADEWQGGKIVEDNLLNNGIQTKRTFKDFKAHLEFRLPFMPYARGQGRGNSGFYPHMSMYEVQILDSFGLEGRNNECGGLYTVRAPDVNMCFPPLTWQTYDVDFKAPRFDDEGKRTAPAIITVRHNGVVIHDKAEIPVCTEDHKRKIDSKPGRIHLQNHGNPVYFRNIWVLEAK
jgi:hypothetical protein